MLNYNRNGLVLAPSDYEKIVIVPNVGETDPCVFAWTDGRFAIDVMMEHALFFVLLMPPELIKEPREEAQAFHKGFSDLLDQVNANGPPKPSDLRTFCSVLTDAIKPFIDYKQRMMVLQTSGTLRSLVWPSFFEHTLDEAQRWVRRLEQLAKGVSDFDKLEVSVFWTEIVKEHDLFTAHLLDIDEKVLVDKAFLYAAQFGDMHASCKGGGACDPCQVLKAAEEALDFDTAAVRGIEAGKIKSIIDPVLADHIRRETLKFVDELKRLPS